MRTFEISKKTKQNHESRNIKDRNRCLSPYRNIGNRGSICSTSSISGYSMVTVQIKSVLGKILFTYENETATIKKAVLEAIKEGADLSGANLSGADLKGADLRGAKKIPMYCKWNHGITDGLIHIGCEKRSVEDWGFFLSNDEVISTKRNTPEFKQIEAVIRGYIAYLNFLKS